MIKPKKNQLQDVSSIKEDIVQTAKSKQLGSILDKSNKLPIGKIISTKELVYCGAFSILLLAAMAVLIFLITRMVGISGLYSAGIVLFVLLVLLCGFVLYKICYGVAERLIYTVRTKKVLDKALDCVNAIIIAKTQDSYIVSKSEKQTTMVDYFCEYVFFDGQNVRTGYFRDRDLLENAQKYNVGDEILVCCNDKNSVAIHPCEVGRYRGIDYQIDREGALQYLDCLPSAKPPSKKVKLESNARFAARSGGFLVFGIALIWVGIYMWKDLQLSPNMVITVRVVATIFLALGGIFSVLGFAAIFKAIFEKLQYISLIKNCQFAYGIMYDDGLFGKKRGYSFVYKDQNGVVNQHIAGVEVCKKVKLYHEGHTNPTVLLVAYNDKNIDIVCKLDADDQEYPSINNCQ